MQILIVEAILLLFLIFTTICIIGVKDILAALIVYCSFSFFAVLLYFMMGAPDVAFTEAVIGVVSTVYFIVVLKNINRWCK